MGRCGTEVVTRRSRLGSAENVVIVQMDSLVQVGGGREREMMQGLMFQEVWDTARRISCTWEDTFQKSIR